MADQDFNIKLTTTYDGTGARRLGEDLDKIKRRQAEAEAKWAVSPLNPKNQGTSGGGIAALGGPPPSGGGGGGVGGIGSLAGIGTITYLLTGAISKWKEFLDTEDKILEQMSEVTRKNYELAQSIIATQDALISQRRTATEPLADSYIRLQQELIRLQTEQKALDLPNQSKEWEDYQKKINATTSEIDKLKSQLQSKGITDVTPVITGPKAGKGESQALVDEIERNRKAAEDQLKEDIWEIDPDTGAYRRTGSKRFPLFQPPPPPAPPSPDNAVATSNQYKSPIGPQFPKGGNITVDILVSAFDAVMGKYFGR